MEVSVRSTSSHSQQRLFRGEVLSLTQRILVIKQDAGWSLKHQMMVLLLYFTGMVLKKSLKKKKESKILFSISFSNTLRLSMLIFFKTLNTAMFENIECSGRDVFKLSAEKVCQKMTSFI